MQMTETTTPKRISRADRALAILVARRAARQNPELVIIKNRDEIIVAVSRDVFDGWEKYGRNAYPRHHKENYVLRAGRTGPCTTTWYRSVSQMLAAYPCLRRQADARVALERKLSYILKGQDEAIVYKTLHVREDGTLVSPYDGSVWEIGTPRTTTLQPIRTEDETCCRGGFFATRDACEWTDYPQAAQDRTDRLVVVQCIGQDIEKIGSKLRARTLCPIGVVMAVESWYGPVHVWTPAA